MGPKAEERAAEGEEADDVEEEAEGTSSKEARREGGTPYCVGAVPKDAAGWAACA